MCTCQDKDFEIRLFNRSYIAIKNVMGMCHSENRHGTWYFYPKNGLNESDGNWKKMLAKKVSFLSKIRKFGLPLSTHQVKVVKVVFLAICFIIWCLSDVFWMRRRLSNHFRPCQRKLLQKKCSLAQSTLSRSANSPKFTKNESRLISV